MAPQQDTIKKRYSWYRKVGRTSKCKGLSPELCKRNSKRCRMTRTGYCRKRANKSVMNHYNFLKRRWWLSSANQVGKTLRLNAPKIV
jgi:hypothetical protein